MGFEPTVRFPNWFTRPVPSATRQPVHILFFYLHPRPFAATWTFSISFVANTKRLFNLKTMEWCKPHPSKIIVLKIFAAFRALKFYHFLYLLFLFPIWYRWVDLNHRFSAYQTDALTSCTTPVYNYIGTQGGSRNPTKDLEGPYSIR